MNFKSSSIKINPRHQSSFFFSFAVLVATSLFAQQKPSTPAAELDRFVGTWTATHNGNQYFVFELRKENGSLAGGIRVCGFTMQGDGEHVDVTITVDKLSETIPIRNLVMSGNSLTFDWKDPDGDDNHLMFERTSENSARLNWRNLPADAKMPAILLARSSAKKS